MASEHESRLIAVAKAEDTYDLLEHIAWDRVIRPKLEEQVSKYSKLLVAEALGTPLPGGMTREQVAGMCYGIQFVTSLFESILAKGERALQELSATGVNVGQ